MNNIWTAVVCGFLLLAPGGAFGENWPQWRGPRLNGSTPETGLPASLSLEGPNTWKTPMPGLGYSTPVVWEDRVFLTSLDAETGELLAVCVDAGSGEVLWRKACGEDRKMAGGNNGATPSAVTDGERVHFYFGTGLLVTCDLEGDELWRRDLEADYGNFVIKFGYSSTPLLYEGRLYIPVLQNETPGRYGREDDREGPLESFLLALGPETGETLWRHVRPTDAEDESREVYITPMPCEAAGRKEVVLVGGECATGHDAATGRELWRWWFQPRDRKVWQRIVTSPVVGHGMIYVTRPRHRPLFALPAGGEGQLPEDYPAWQHGEFTPDVTTPLLYRDRIYFMHDGNRTMVCADPLTGRVLWQQRLEGRGPFRASPTGADGKIYLIDKRGTLIVLAAGDEFRELSRLETGEGPCQSTISVSGGRLFIRTAKNLYGVAGGDE